MAYDLLQHIRKLEERLVVKESWSFKNWQHPGQSDSKALSNKTTYLNHLRASIEERKELAVKRGLIS